MRCTSFAQTQWRLPDGCVGTQVAEHGAELALNVSRPDWPFPRLVTVARSLCQRVTAPPMNTHTLEEARW